MVFKKYMNFFSVKFKYCSIFLFLAFFSLSAESFRIHKIIPITFTQIEEKIDVTSGINDALFITFPDDLTYVSGVELNLKIPEEIITWRDSVAYILYENLTPSPSKENLNYHGERLYVSTIPGNFSLNIYIPISSDFAIKANPYSEKLPTIKNFSNQRGIFLRFMMVMKGVPDSLENATLEISAKQVLKNNGMLSLSVTTPEQPAKNYTVFIDDSPMQDFKQKILQTGEHHLSIVSDFYRNELRTFRIEQAKTTSLSVNLRKIEPLLKLICPKETIIFLDGSQIQMTNAPLEITQGEHIVKFVFGDYEVTKSISAQNGRTYSVNLNIDAIVTEEN